jgi:hypothetical protein
MKPLDGIRVLDLSRVLAGPYATALMADLGAEIIKIEPPQGDDYRHIGPFRDGESALFTLNNRGKQSLALDLKDPAHLRIAQAIAARRCGRGKLSPWCGRAAGPWRGCAARGKSGADLLLGLGLWAAGAVLRSAGL